MSTARKWLILFCFPLFSMASMQTVEQLEKIKTDIGRKEQLYKTRGYIYRKALRFPPAQADSTLFYAQMLLRQGNDTSRISGVLIKGIAHYRAGRFDSSAACLERVMTETANNAHFLPEYMNAKSHLALLYLRTQHLSRARTLFEELLRLAERKGLKEEAVKTNVNLGLVYRHMGQPRKAIGYFQRAIVLDSTNVFTTANAYMNIGALYAMMEEYGTADGYFRKALRNQVSGTPFSIAILNNLADNFKKRNLPDSMAYYYRLALSGALPQKLNHQIIRPLRELALYESERGRYQKAEKLFRQAQAHARDAHIPAEILNTYIETARFYLKWKKYEQSLQQGRHALEFARRQKTRLFLRDTYKTMAEAYDGLGDLQQAHLYLQRYTRLKDSTDTVARQRMRLDIRAGFDVEKEQERVRKAERENRKTHTKFLLLAVFFTLLLLLSIWLYLRYRKKTREKARLETSVERQQEVIRKLQEKIVAYNRVEERDGNYKNYILLKNNQKIDFCDLIYIKVDGHYLDYHTTLQEQPFIERQALKQIIPLLPRVLFIQIHRSYIVNISFIKSFSSRYLTLKNGREIKISRTYKPRLKEVLYSDN